MTGTIPVMKIDVTRAIGAVTREVASRDYDGRPARVVVVTRDYATTMDDVWDALTNPERIPRWFMPVSGELRLGGRYQLTGNAGGTVTSCDPPRSFGLTWEYGGSVSWVTVQLAEKDGRTELKLEHLAHVGPDDRWDQFGPGAAGVGWDMGLLGLTEHLSGAPRVTPEDGMQWAMSDEGRQFIAQSSDDWGRASIAAGTPEADARAAAERTRAAYTGEA
jgi:uncharacterized protein YndB with AHSA1/START domain